MPIKIMFLVNGCPAPGIRYILPVQMENYANDRGLISAWNKVNNK